MITLKDYFEVIDYKITEGGDYQWNCYGPEAYMLDSSVLNKYDVNVIFDKQTQVVFEMTAVDYKKNNIYRWIHPDHIDDYKKECKKRKEPFDKAWDDEKYTDLEVAEDMIEKARAIVQGKKYDTRIQVPLELPQKEMYRLMKLAHEKDMTLNKYVETVLTKLIDEQKVPG